MDVNELVDKFTADGNMAAEIADHPVAVIGAIEVLPPEAPTPQAVQKRRSGRPAKAESKADGKAPYKATKSRKGAKQPPSPALLDYRRQQRERTMERAATAFEKYVELGDERSYARVAEIMGCRPRVIMEWSTRFGWKDKVRELTHQAISTTVVEPVTEQLKKRKAHLRLIDFMLKDAAVLDKDGNIIGSNVVLKSMQDIQRALETRENILNENKRGPNGVFGPNTQIGQAVFILKR